MAKFQSPTSNTFRDMNYYPVFWSSPYGQTDRRTESDTYEPTVQNAQVGSKTTAKRGSSFSPGVGKVLTFLLKYLRDQLV